MKVVFSPLCLRYDHGPYHPESPRRVKLILDTLVKSGFQIVPGRQAEIREILEVHEREHLDRIVNRNYFDPDTPVIDPTFPLLAAGCSIKAARMKEAFALVRPPGHHAGRNFLGGFCYFNNLAIGVKCVYEKKRVAILDLDAHHGNGTQDVFLGRSNVLYVSLHQYPLFPMTGKESIDNCLNYPLPPGTNGKTYLKTLRKAVNEIERFHPHALAISLGFDAYAGDPLSDLRLQIRDFYRLGEVVGGLVKEIDCRYFFVLEGGYSERIGELALEFFRGFQMKV